jgi:predicted transposase YbfD/YdcC
MAIEATSEFRAIAEATVFLGHFSDLPDRRQAGKVVCPLNEVLLLSLLAVLAGAEGFSDIARFGENKLSLLRRFLPFADGTPPHDTLGDIFAALDARAFQRCFVNWVSALTKIPAEVIAIDGKTMRRTGAKQAGKAPVHMVSAFAARQRLVLAQTKVNEKSNEIIAIPALLDMLEIEGAVITIDAMGCQRAIAEKIIARKADYLLALKGNQGALHEDVEVFVTEQKERDFAGTTISTHKTVDADHGRIETRNYTVIHDAGWLQERHNWPGLKGVIVVDSTRQFVDKTETETRLYLTSTSTPAQLAGPMVRDHWAIENSLHWVLDCTFHDDQCRIRTQNAPANFATLSHIAHNLYRRPPGKDSVRLRRKTAAWNDDYLIKLLAA